MEDFYETRIDGVNGEMVGFFGVFDGICQPFVVNLHIFLVHTFSMLASKIEYQRRIYNPYSFEA